MDIIINFLLSYGYWGMFLSAMLAGSFLPFSSEAVMAGLQAAGLKAMPLIIYGTIGNVLGGLFNYWIGTFGNMDWIERWLHVKKEKIERAQRFMAGRGAWMGFFGFIPFLGSAITIALGMMRANLFISTVSMTIGKFLRYAALAYGLTLLTSCTNSKPEATADVVVTIEPYRWITEQLAGPSVKVMTLVPPGAGPETYEPTARQMVEAAGAKLYMAIGTTTFEKAWLGRLKETNPQLTIVDTSEGLGGFSDRTGYRLGQAPKLYEDPHVWMSVRNMSLITRSISNALVKAFPQQKAVIEHRRDSLTNELIKLDINISKEMQACHHRSFVIYHPALSYFALDYKLQQIAIEEGGREPSAAQLAAIISRAKAEKARVFLVQREFANLNNKVIEQELQLRPTLINPLAYNYPQEMRRIARCIAQAQ